MGCLIVVNIYMERISIFVTKTVLKMPLLIIAMRDAIYKFDLGAPFEEVVKTY